MLPQILFISIDVPLDTKELSARENKIISHIIRKLAADNGKYYIEHEEGLNTFRIFEDPQQKEKDRFFKLLLNTEKK